MFEMHHHQLLLHELSCSSTAESALGDCMDTCNMQYCDPIAQAVLLDMFSGQNEMHSESLLTGWPANQGLRTYFWTGCLSIGAST